ncbi:MAG TPA: HAD-IA family hydrolase [Pseudomonadales bacterium]|jgi:putative hydrolase of the HAD superfamily|nr:HAD-IA family hydrolase [Pseudomonadales bacterium]
MIQAVLWDFGGVLTTSPFDAFNRFEAEQGIPKDFIRGINATNPEHNAWARLESSAISLAQFDAEFEAESRAAGHPVRGQSVIELLSGDLRPRMVQVLTTCKQRFKVACLTNNVKSGEGPGMARTTERASEMQRVMELFDLVLESSKEGIRKPNPAFYLRACERLRIKPNQAVFLDDLGINLKPAKELGMTTIKVSSEDQAIAELSDVLRIDFRV